MCDPGIFDNVILLAVLDIAWNEWYQTAQTITLNGTIHILN